MTKEQYVNQVVKRIKCSGTKKKDIKRELLADIEMRSSQGEKMEDIIAGMGSVKEVADSFNENISSEELKRYIGKKTVIIVISILLAVVLLMGIVYMFLPKATALENSRYFSKDQVEDTIRQVIEHFDEGDFDWLQENAIGQMKTVMTRQSMDTAKSQLADNWGERVSFGTLYAQEVSQGKTHYAVGQIVVVYENVSVTYTITLDEDMQLAGLYMR